MPEISPALFRALNKGYARFLLFYCDHPEGPQRFWSRTGSLTVEGQTYTGVGGLGRVSGVSRSTNLTINDVTFELRGVTPTAETFLSGLVRNRQATITLGAMGPRGHIVIDSDPMIDALLEYQKFNFDPRSNTATIMLMGKQGFTLLDRAQELAWTDQQQRSEYPEDCGMALNHLWVDRESNWRAA
jgi:hypothetical protein